MVVKAISGVRVKAITSSIPSGTEGPDFFSALYGKKEAARVTRGTGISTIRSANGATTSDMILAAANHLLGHIDANKSAIDGVIVVTQTPDRWSPGAAFTLHHQLGLPVDCVVVNINDGCAGYSNGLIQAASLIHSGACNNILLCTGDVNTRLVDDSDYQLRMLFGDAASATLVTGGDDTLTFISGADGSGRELLGVGLNYEKRNAEVATLRQLKMDGAAVMSFALKRVPEAINTLLQHKGLGKSDIDLFALHQPNEFILNYLRDILEVEPEKLPIDVEGVGNTNSTSIPLLLSRYDWQKEAPRENIVLCGFGVGLAWNALHLDLTQTAIIEPLEMN